MSTFRCSSTRECGYCQLTCRLGAACDFQAYSAQQPEQRRSVRFEYAKNAFNASNINWAYAKWASLANMNDPKEGLVSRDDKVVIQQRHG